jgi:hemerythrin-like domain-containing protein
MKFTDRLIGDHKTFRKMIADIEEIYRQVPDQRDGKKLVRTVELFKSHLLIHAWAEDRFYYPAISKEIERFKGSPINSAYMNHLDHEHKTVDGYLDRLLEEVRSQPIVRSWPQTFALFQHGLSAHMRKEEEELFPESERVMGADRLIELSHELERHRGEAPKVQMHTRL